MGDATVNGDMPHSSTLSHIHSYPVVSDTVDTFKTYPVGRMSIDVTNAAYVKLVKPTLPYFQTPASYASPYVAKADELGDAFLSKFDEKIPVLKTETKDIKSNIMSMAGWPINKAGETRDWVLGTYNDEYKKCGGNGVVAGGKALVTSSLVITSETLQWLSEFLAAKKEDAKEVAKNTKQAAIETANETKDKAEKTANQTRDQAEKTANQTKDKAEKKASETKEQAEKKANH